MTPPIIFYNLGQNIQDCRLDPQQYLDSNVYGRAGEHGRPSETVETLPGCPDLCPQVCSLLLIDRAGNHCSLGSEIGPVPQGASLRLPPTTSIRA